MEIKKCPNCGANLELQKSKRKWRCPYCDSVYEAEVNSKDKDELFPSDLFIIDFDVDRLMKKKEMKECVNAWTYCLNEMGNVSEVEDYLRKCTVEDLETAMKGVREERLTALRGRIDPELESGERVIILVDQSFVGKGKEFLIITDRACRFFDKKGAKSIKIDDIVTMKMDDFMSLPKSYLNGSIDYSVSPVGCGYHTLGILFALISLLAFENNPDRERIMIKM